MRRRDLLAGLALVLVLGLPWVGAPFHFAHTHLREAVLDTVAVLLALVGAIAAGRARGGRAAQVASEEEVQTHLRSSSRKASGSLDPDPGDAPRQSQGDRSPDAPTAWIAALAGWGFFSTAWSATPRSTWMAAALWLAVGFLVARARRGARSWDDARTQLAGAGAGLLLAAAALASWIQPFAGLGGAAGCGPFGGTTTAATAGALLLPIAFRAALVAARARDRALALASAVALAVWVFSLGVRASWIAVVGSALFVLAGSIGARARGLAVVATGLALVAGWLCPWRLFPAGGPGNEFRDARQELLAALDFQRDSSGERLTLWRNGLELVARAPWLGHGLGRLRDEYPLALEHGSPHSFTSLDVHRSPHHLHSDPLEVWVELGPLGLSLWIALALACWRATRGAPASRGVLVSFGLLGLFHTTLHDPVALALLAPALAAAPVSPVNREPLDRRTSRLRQLGAAAALASALVATALGAWGTWRRVAADRAHDAALRALAATSLDAAQRASGLECARRAVALDPEDTEKLLGLAAWLRRVGVPEAALPVLESAALRGPGSLARRGLHAEILRDLGRPLEAEAILEELLKLQPQNREAHVALSDWAERDAGPGAGRAPLERLSRAIPWLDDPRFWARLGRDRLQAHTTFGAPRLLASAEDALQRALAKPGLESAEHALVLTSLIDARLRMRGRARPIEGLDQRLRQIWPAVNPEEIRADLLGRLRTLSATLESEGRAEEARRLELLVSDLIAR